MSLRGRDRQGVPAQLRFLRQRIALYAKTNGGVQLLALNTLGIRCAVVSNYTKDHSWNLVEIDGQWYFCDLTNGIGTGNTEGMVVSYSSCLVGAESFLTSHPGYTMKDIYGEANSDGLNIRKLPLAQSDYIPPRSSIRTGISSRTCLFYQGGWWYWISTGNMLKKSRLNGSGEQTVYAPADDAHIGWAEEFDEMILISINDRIYRMNYKGQLKGEVRQVLSTEYRHAVSSYFWQIAYVGRFYRNADDTIGYYITDLTGARKGVGQISLSGDVFSGSSAPCTPVFFLWVWRSSDRSQTRFLSSGSWSFQALHSYVWDFLSAKSHPFNDSAAFAICL